MNLVFLLFAIPHLLAGEAFPTIYGLEFGFTVDQAKETLAKNKGLKPPELNKTSTQNESGVVEILSLKSRANSEQEKKWTGIRSVELRFHKNELFEIDVYVYEDGRESFKETKNKYRII